MILCPLCSFGSLTAVDQFFVISFEILNVVSVFLPRSCQKYILADQLKEGKILQKILSLNIGPNENSLLITHLLLSLAFYSLNFGFLLSNAMFALIVLLFFKLIGSLSVVDLG